MLARLAIKIMIGCALFSVGGVLLHAAETKGSAEAHTLKSTVTNKVNTLLGNKTTTGKAKKGTALAVLATLTVKPDGSMSTYNRTKDFGTAWTDNNGDPDGHNGCDTRDDILKRDLTNLTYGDSAHCVVTKGTFHDPYTGTTTTFVRGPESILVQIDHQVPLGNAWVTGAQNLTQAQRVNLANDPLNLVAANGSQNEKKGDLDASGYLPPNKSFDCRYVSNQIAVKVKYDLWVTKQEKGAMTNVLHTCPSESLSTEPGGVRN